MSNVSETFFAWFKTLSDNDQADLLAEIYDFQTVLSKGLYSGPHPAMKGRFSGPAPSSFSAQTKICPTCGKPR